MVMFCSSNGAGRARLGVPSLELSGGSGFVLQGSNVPVAIVSFNQSTELEDARQAHGVRNHFGAAGTIIAHNNGHSCRGSASSAGAGHSKLSDSLR